MRHRPQPTYLPCVDLFHDRESAAFCVLQSIRIPWFWIALLCRWLFHRDKPSISSYLIVDFAFKSRQHTCQSDEIARTKIDVSAHNAAIRQLLKHAYTAVCHAKKPVSTE